MEQEPERLRARPKARTAPPKVAVREREKTVSIEELLAAPVAAPPIVEEAVETLTLSTTEALSLATTGPLTLGVTETLSLAAMSLAAPLQLPSSAPLSLGEPEVSLRLTLNNDGPDQATSLTLRARDKLIRDQVVVVVMPPPPPAIPSGVERIWMPQWRRDACYELVGVAPWPMVRAGSAYNFDEALASKLAMGMPMWDPDVPSGLVADRAYTDDEMFSDWPHLPHRDPYFTPERDGVALWDLVMGRFADHRYDLFHQPERLHKLPLRRYQCGKEWYAWGGVAGQTFTIEDIIAEKDRPDAEVTSLLALVCDQIAWQLPELLPGGSELKEWQQLLEIDAQHMAPITNFVFPHLHEFDGTDYPRPIVRGRYRAANKVDYVSAAGLLRDEAPWGVIGWRALTMEPDYDYESLPKHMCEIDCDGSSCEMEGKIWWNGQWADDRTCEDPTCMGCSEHESI